LVKYWRSGNQSGAADALAQKGQALEALGDFVQARACYEEALRLRQEQRQNLCVAHLLELLTGLAQSECDYTEADRLLAERQEIVAHVHALQGMAARDQGDLKQARTLLSGSLAFWQSRRHPRWIAGMRRQLAITAFYEGKHAEAETLLRQSLTGLQSVADRYS